jgi:hypothetical protein
MSSSPAAPITQQPSWQPPEGVLDHAGKKLAADRDFHAHPPAEIGAVVSAWSTLRQGQVIRATWMRVLFCIQWAIGCQALFELGILIARRYLSAAEDMLLLARGIGVTFSPCVGLLAAYQTRWRERCTYVGRDGIAEFWFTSRRHVRCRVLRFADASWLFVHRVEVRFHGAYTGTKYVFRWYAPKRAVMVLKGDHQSQQGTPPPASHYWFAASAERAWSNFLLARMEEERKRTGFARFTIDAKRSIAVAPGVLRMTNRDKTDEIDSDDLAAVELHHGALRIRTKTASRFFSKGHYTFDYAKIPNALALLTVIDRWVLQPVDLIHRPAA